MTAKRQACDDSMREYESEVKKMKVVQDEHYKTAMPHIFQVSNVATRALCGLRGVMRRRFDFRFRRYIYCLLVYIVCFPA